MSESPRLKVSLNSILQVIVTIYQGAAILAFVFALFLARKWVNLPFLGALFEQTMLRNTAGPSQPSEAWTLYGQTEFGDQLIAVNGVPVRDSTDIESVLRGITPGTLPTSGGFSAGETIPVTIRTTTGEEKTFDVKLDKFPMPDYIGYVVIPFIVSGLFLLTSLWIFGLRRGESAGRAFSLFASSLAIVLGTLFDLFTTHGFTYLWTLAVVILGGSMVDMAMTFPQEFRPAIRRPYVRWIGYVIGLPLAIYASTTLFDFQHPNAYIGAWQILYLFVGISGLIYFGFMFHRVMFSPSPVVKSQARTILFGAVIGFSLLVVWMLNAFLGLFEFPFSTTLFLPLAIFPASIGYTILRFRLIQTDTWMRQSLIYALLTVFVVGGIGIIVTGLTLIFKGFQPFSNTWMIIGLAFLVAVLLNPLHNRLQGMVDNAFFRGQRAYLKNQQEFTHKLANVVDQTGISLALRESLMSTLAPDRTHIYVYESLNDQYAATPGSDSRPTSDIRFASSSSLAHYFQQERLPLYLDGANLPAALKEEECAPYAIRGAALRPLAWQGTSTRLGGAGLASFRTTLHAAGSGIRGKHVRTGLPVH